MNTVSIGKESIPEPLMAGNGTVGTTEALLTGALAFAVNKWIVIHADSANGDDILVGAPGHAASGYILHAGESTPPLYVDNTNKIAVIGGDAAQAYSWFGQ